MTPVPRPTASDRERAWAVLLGGASDMPAAERYADRVAAAIAAARAKGEAAGYERGRRDFQFEPSGDNHHNAALCPYCSPDRAEDAHGLGKCVTVEDANRVLADERRGRDAAIQAVRAEGEALRRRVLRALAAARPERTSDDRRTEGNQ